MGVRPPQRSDDEAPDTVAFGIAALDEHLDSGVVTFPTTDAELVAALDDPAIPFDAKGNELRLSTALEEASGDEYGSRQELMNALHPVFEAKRERANNSIVGQLRSLLPF